MYIATKSTTLPASLTQPISLKQQQQHGPDQVVVHQENPKEKYEENTQQRSMSIYTYICI